MREGAAVKLARIEMLGSELEVKLGSNQARTLRGGESVLAGCPTYGAIRGQLRARRRTCGSFGL